MYPCANSLLLPWKMSQVDTHPVTDDDLHPETFEWGWYVISVDGSDEGRMLTYTLPLWSLQRERLCQLRTGNTANWQWCYYSLKSYYSLKMYCSPWPLPAMPLLSSMSPSPGQILLFLPTVAFLQGLKTLQLYGCWRENLRKKLRCTSQKWHNLCF